MDDLRDGSGLKALRLVSFIIMAAGALTVLIGSFLVWGTSCCDYIRGFESSGKIVVPLSFIALAACLFLLVGNRYDGMWPFIVIFFSVLIVAGILTYHMVDPLSIADPGIYLSRCSEVFEKGAGVYVAFYGSLSMLLAMIILFSSLVLDALQSRHLGVFPLD